jgi:hypothetical protein
MDMSDWAGILSSLACMMLGLGAVPLLVYVALWPQPRGNATAAKVDTAVFDTAVVAQLARRIGDLEDEVRRAEAHTKELLDGERRACDERLETLMRQLLRMTLRLEALDGGKRPEEAAVRLYDMLVDRVGEDELRLLAFDVGVEYESLTGDNAHARALSMVVRMKRENRLPQMIECLQKRRPDVVWPLPQTGGHD